MPAWNFSTEPVFFADVVAVGWRLAGASFVEVSRFPFTIPIAPGDKTVTVPMDKLDHGPYDLSYKLIIGGNEKESLKKRITVDRVPPDDGQEPALLELWMLRAISPTTTSPGMGKYGSKFALM